jgi:hypothetical protein
MNEYWIVKDRTTGKVIAHCGDINDAMMLVSFNPNNRTYSRHRVLMDQVIDVISTTDKQLPGQIGLPSGKVNSLQSHKIRLPENQQEPVRI